MAPALSIAPREPLNLDTSIVEENEKPLSHRRRALASVDNLATHMEEDDMGLQNQPSLAKDSQEMEQILVDLGNTDLVQADLLQAIKTLESGGDGLSTGDPEAMFPLSGFDLAENVDSEGDSVEDKINAVQTRLERRCAFLQRRLRILQARAIGKRVSEEAAQTFEKCSRAARKDGGGRPVGLKTFLKSVETTSALQAGASSKPVTGPKYYNPGTSKGESSKSSSIGVPPGTLAGLEDTAGALRSHLSAVKHELDSDATASSSGAESNDEAVSYSNPHQQTLPIEKRALWTWQRSRASIAYRWGWLQAQVQELEYRIRQHNELHHQVREAKGPVEFEGEPVGYQGSLPGAEVPEDGLATETCARVRPLRRETFKKRKLLQMHNLHMASSKAAKPSDVRCSCEHPIESCSVCTGRAEPNQPAPAFSTQSRQQRLANIDASYHPVLSDLKGNYYMVYVAIESRSVCTGRAEPNQPAPAFSTQSRQQRLANIDASYHPVLSDLKGNYYMVYVAIESRSVCTGRAEPNQPAPAFSTQSRQQRLANIDASYHPVLSDLKGNYYMVYVAIESRSVCTGRAEPNQPAPAFSTQSRQQRLANIDASYHPVLSDLKGNYYMVYVAIESRSVCTGRAEPNQPAPAFSTQSRQQRLANIDASYHPVLSDLKEVPLSCHMSAVSSRGWFRARFTKATRGAHHASAVPRASPAPAAPTAPRVASPPHRAPRRHPTRLRRGRPPLSRRRDRDRDEETPAGHERVRGRSSTESRSWRRQSYDIDNIVIPQSVAANTRPQILTYKEIITPKWRVMEIPETSMNNGVMKSTRMSMESDEEDVSDLAVQLRHTRAEGRERERYVRKRRRRDQQHELLEPHDQPLEPAHYSTYVAPPAPVLRESPPPANSYAPDETVRPYTPRSFPLADDLYADMLAAMPAGHRPATPPPPPRTPDHDDDVSSSLSPLSPPGAFDGDDPDDAEWDPHAEKSDRRKNSFR